MILCCATATPVSTVPKCRLNSSFRHISAHMSSETWPLSQCAKRDRFPQIPASLRSERRFVAARVESSFQAKDEQVYSAADLADALKRLPQH